MSPLNTSPQAIAAVDPVIKVKATASGLRQAKDLNVRFMI
jgi:hypothetical protein